MIPVFVSFAIKYELMHRLSVAYLRMTLTTLKVMHILKMNIVKRVTDR